MKLQARPKPPLTAWLQLGLAQAMAFVCKNILHFYKATDWLAHGKKATQSNTCPPHPRLQSKTHPKKILQHPTPRRQVLQFSPLFFFLTSLFTYISLDIFSLYWFYSYMITHPQYAYSGAYSCIAHVLIHVLIHAQPAYSWTALLYSI